MSEQRYQVVWPYTTVKIHPGDSGSPTVVGYNADAIIPLSADPQDVKRLVAKGALKKVTTAESEPAKPAAKTEPKAEPKVEPKAEAKAEAKTDGKAEPKSAKAGNGS